ncbi:MAG: YoaK family protein [Silvanigrellaceae bacterium]
MTSGTIRSFYDYLGVGSLLACVAGVVNAVGFVGFGGFVTHVSGNATRSAVEYSEGHVLVAGVFFVGIVFFISGAFTTTLLLRGHSIESPKVTYAFPILLEAVLIGCVAWFGSRHVSPGQTLEITKLKDAWFLNLLTFAMGMQNAIIRQGSGTIIRTTHMTGIVTDLGIAIGTVVSRSSAEFFKNPKHFLQRQQNQEWSSLLMGRIHTIYQRFHLERFFLHTSLLLSFLLGAVLGTFGYLRVGLKVLTAPLIVLVLLAALELVNWRKRTSRVAVISQHPV